MLNQVTDSKRIKVAEFEEAWNVLTDEYENLGIPKGAIVVSSRLMPKSWNLRDERLLVLMIEGMGDRGPTGAPFIRKVQMDKTGVIRFSPGGSDPDYPITLLGFVTEMIGRQEIPAKIVKK